MLGSRLARLKAMRKGNCFVEIASGSLTKSFSVLKTTNIPIKQGVHSSCALSIQETAYLASGDDSSAPGSDVH
jgi:hypothetical protein